MMKNIFYKMLVLCIVNTLIFTSCVSSKKFKELQSKRDITEVENNKLKDENRQLSTMVSELSQKNSAMQLQIEALKADTNSLGKNYRIASKNYNNLNSSYEDLLSKYNDLSSGNQAETKKILTELQKAQQDLMRRENALSKLEKEYADKKLTLDKMSQQLTQAQSELTEKEKAYNDLRKEVAAKDSIMNSLKNSVSNALTGFENNGLTVTRKNGQVYVSMDEKLLFASGSFAINPKGQEALIKLAKVLENNKDIKILVEGHTDNVPYNGARNVNDNWDLSVKRATSIVRVLSINSKINPQQITAAGRGEFMPISSNETSEGRAKNRRSEIILQPNLEKLYDLVK